MKNLPFSLLSVLLVSASLWTAGCEKEGPPADPHAGHDMAATKEMEGHSMKAAGGAQHTAHIIQVKQTNDYTYLQVTEATEQYWIAAGKVVVAPGTRVQFRENVWMNNFESKALQTTFTKILFATDLTYAVAGATVPGTEVTPEKSLANPADTARAEDAGSKTIAEIYTGKAGLAGKKVTVQGTVVKMTRAVMQRNWITLEDGSGSGDTARLMVTATEAAPEVGTKVSLEGVVGVDKDLGHGYFYAVLLENASLKN